MSLYRYEQLEGTWCLHCFYSEEGRRDFVRNVRAVSV